MYILEKLTVGFLIKIVKCPTEKKVYIPVFFFVIFTKPHEL